MRLRGSMLLVLLGTILTAGVHATDGPSAGARITAGATVFQRWCVACHGEGPDKPGTSALQAKYAGRLPAPLLQRTDLTTKNVSFYVRHGVSVMPPFRKTEISDEELAALAAYLTRTKR